MNQPRNEVLEHLYEVIKRFDRLYQFGVQLKLGDAIEYTGEALADANKLHAEVSSLLSKLDGVITSTRSLFDDPPGGIDTKAIKG